MIKLQLISRGNEGRNIREHIHKQIQQSFSAQTNRLTLSGCGFCKREESASPQRFNYSYQCVLDFQKRVEAVHIQATQWIKRHANCDRGTNDKDAKPPSDAEKERAVDEWEKLREVYKAE